MSVIYHGNNKNWVNQEYLKMVLDGVGDQRPRTDEEDEAYKKEQFEKWYSLGYDLKGAGWSMHYYQDMGMQSMSDMVLPIDLPGTLEWWFVKINPTMTFPMHVDAFKTESKNFRRFWIPMQDYIPGHIFIYEDEMITKYKAGDIYEFTNPYAWHGAGNISYEPKVSFQLVCYDL
jgi:hypothetical protein